MNVFSRPDGLTRPVPADRHASDDHLSGAQPARAGQGVRRRRVYARGPHPSEAESRLRKSGLNLITRERKATIPQELWGRARNPLNALLLTLAVVS